MSTVNQLTRIPRLKKYRRSKSPALLKSPFKAGVCTKVYTVNPKKPNSAIRRIAKVLLSTGKSILCYIPGINNPGIQKYSRVLIRGGRRRDLPGIKYQLLKGKLDFSYREGEFERQQRRSKFGIPRGFYR